MAHVSIESLENRILLFGTTTDVTSVVASGAGIVAGTGVVYAGHDITLTVNLSAAASVNTSQGSPTLSLSDGRIATYTGGSGTTALTFDYTVMQGDVSSDLAVTAFNFNGSLIKVSGVTGVFNANMTGAVTNPAGILQIAGSSPQVQSITFGAPGLPTTSATTVSFNVTFSEPVIGVTASSFQVVTGGSVADSRIQVTPVSGSVYTVMVSGITGNGTLGLNLADNGTIHDLAGNALVNPSSPISFAPQTTTAGISGFSLVTVADLNGDGKLDLITSNFNNSFVGVFLGNGDGTFQPEQTYAVGLDPEGIVVGDVNGDGKPDIITANYGSRNAKGSTVSVLLNNGAGTFQTQQTFSTGLEPAGLALADLNGDGKADLVVTNYFSNTVSILLGNGDGTFQAQQTFATGAEPYTVSVGDLNGDGKPDIVVANYGGNSVGVLMGNGDGTFQPQVTYSVASSTPNSYLGAVSLGDVNGDGKLDILVTNTAGSATNGNLGVLLGNGDGTFQAQQTYAAGLNPTELATADFNGDGSLDVVTTNHSDLTISVMPGNGDGTFQTQQTYATAAGTRPNDVVTGDFTGDGKPDIVVTNSNGTINLFANTTAGSYTGPVYNIINTPAAVTSVVATGTGISNGNGDLNDNHVVTLTVSFSTPVTVGTTGGLPTLALNDGGTATYAGGSGTSSLTFTYTVLAGQNTNALTVAALNLNGSTIQNAAGNANLSGVVSSLTGSLQIDTNLPFVDLINLESPATGPSVSFTVVFNEPVIGVDASAFQAVTGGSVADSQIQVTPLSTSFYTVTVSGVTGNGTLGLNLVDNGQIHDLAGNALTNPLAPISFVTGQTTSVNPGVQQATAADVNADGKLDLIVLNGPSNSLGVLLGNGDGTFQAQQTYAVGPGAYSTTVGDVNGDGKPDIIVAIPGSTSSPGHTVGVLLNNGDGTFQPLQTYATGAGAASVKLADLNGDGKPDLIAANYANNTVSVLLGNGDGTFQAQQTFATGDRPYSISVGDLNGDGHPDLVVADVIDNAVSVLLGNGDGTFQPQQTISMARGVPGSYTSAVAVADLNGDGKLDLIVADPAGSTVSGATEVLLGNGDGTFQAPQTYAIGVNSNRYVAVDFNGDGKLDIATGNRLNASISVLQGNGDGTFQARQTFATTAGNRLINLAAADFNGDGKPDIVAFNNIGTSNLLVNTTTGNYTGPVFQVVNAVQTAINIGTIPDIQYGTSTQVVSGQLVTSIPIPIGESVNVAIDGVAHSALVDSHGNFTLSFASSTLATGQHTVEVDFAGDTQLLASTATSSFHVTQATPAIVVVDQGGTYTGNPFPANATVTGVGGATVSGTVTYTYFGPTVLGNTAPTNVGNYSVVATFTSSDPNYNGVQSQPVAFSIVPGAPSKLAFVPLLPSRLTAGNSTGVISVQVQDKFGNLVTTDSSTSLSLKINGVVIGTTTDQGGVATFAGATLNLAGQVSIVVSASGLLAASTSITVLPSSPNHLVFTTPPATSIVAGKPLSDFKVAVEDTFGNIVTTDANPIALSITALTGNASTTSFTSSYANGVTTFSNLTFNTTGAYTVGAIDSLETSVTGVVSSRITVAAAPATTMTVLHGLPTVPVTAGVAIAQPVQIALYDQFGNLATNDTSMVALNVISGGHFSSGQTSVSVRAVGGIATFNNLTFNQVGTYSLSATDTEASLVNGNGTISVGSIHVVATTASKLVLSAPLPSTLTAGGFTGAFAVQIQDRFGNLETTDNSTVLTLNVNGVSVGTSKASGGIASFSGVQLTAARTTTIQVTATGLTSTSASIVVTPGTPTHLAVTSQPSSTVVAGNTIASVKVAVEDAYNNIVTADSSSINLAISGGSASFANPPMISYASGVTTFSNLVINQAGAFKLVASDTSEPSVTGATSNTVTVTPAPATTMTVLRGLPTANVTAGVAIAPSVQIAVHDRFGNLVTNDSSIVTLTITSGGHFSTGLTSLSVRLSGGIADFRSMVFNLAGTYTLTATDTEASLINGNGTINVGSVQVVAAAASKLVFTPALPTTLSAGSSTGTITVSEVDRFGNVVASDNSTTLTLKINGVVIGTATVSNGLAKFSGALLTKLGANSVVVSATGRTSASATITVQ